MARTWFITGASSGLGREMAQQLLARGDRVAGTSRRPEANDDLAREHGNRFVSVTLDVTDVAAIRAATDEAFRRLGRVDVMVSNAGYGLVGASEELADGDIDRQIATNLTGSIQLIRASLPHLRAQGGGRIMQVSSAGGQMAFPYFSLYHATKWGIEGFVEAVAQEVGVFGIDFIIAEPGPTATGFRAGLVHAPKMKAYDATPADEVRQAIETGSFVLTGDAAKTAAAMIAACDSNKPDLRLVLGSGAYTPIVDSLRRRLAEAEAQREIAFSVDRD